MPGFHRFSVHPADFLPSEKSYAFRIVNEEAGYLIRTSAPVFDATESAQDEWTDFVMETCPQAFVSLFVPLELAFMLSVTMLQRRRQYPPALLQLLDEQPERSRDVLKHHAL